MRAQLEAGFRALHTEAVRLQKIRSALEARKENLEMRLAKVEDRTQYACSRRGHPGERCDSGHCARGSWCVHGWCFEECLDGKQRTQDDPYRCSSGEAVTIIESDALEPVCDLPGPGQPCLNNGNCRDGAFCDHPADLAIPRCYDSCHGTVRISGAAMARANKYFCKYPVEEQGAYGLPAAPVLDTMPWEQSLNRLIFGGQTFDYSPWSSSLPQYRSRVVPECTWSPSPLPGPGQACATGAVCRKGAFCDDKMKMCMEVCQSTVDRWGTPKTLTVPRKGSLCKYGSYVPLQYELPEHLNRLCLSLRCEHGIPDAPCTCDKLLNGPESYIAEVECLPLSKDTQWPTFLPAQLSEAWQQIFLPLKVPLFLFVPRWAALGNSLLVIVCQPRQLRSSPYHVRIDQMDWVDPLSSREHWMRYGAAPEPVNEHVKHLGGEALYHWLKSLPLGWDTRVWSVPRVLSDNPVRVSIILSAHMNDRSLPWLQRPVSVGRMAVIPSGTSVGVSVPVLLPADSKPYTPNKAACSNSGVVGDGVWRSTKMAQWPSGPDAWMLWGVACRKSCPDGWMDFGSVSNNTEGKFCMPRQLNRGVCENDPTVFGAMGDAARLDWARKCQVVWSACEPRESLPTFVPPTDAEVTTLH